MSLHPPSWVYILRLRSGGLYIGATTDLPRRLADHVARGACRTTSLDSPTGLAYREPCRTFSAARLREAQLKRWSRAKKEALVAGDFATLHRMARRVPAIPRGVGCPDPMRNLVAIADRIARARRDRRATCPSEDEILSALGPARELSSTDEGIGLRLSGWEQGILKISTMRVIRHFSGVGLKEGKAHLDALLGGEAACVRVRAEDVVPFTQMLRAMGVERVERSH